MKLTDTQLRNLKPTPGQEQKLFDGGGLFLFVSKAGAKIWRLAYRYCGKAKTLSIGPYPTVTLREAREKREEAKKQLIAGIDPSAHRQATKIAREEAITNTFEAIAREWYLTHTANMTPKHRNKILYRLERLLFPSIGKKPIKDLDAPDILAAVKAVETRGHHETAHRLIQLTGQVFRFAIASGRARHNIAADLKDALRPVKVQHRASITDPKKIGVLLRTLDEYSGHFSVIYALRLIPHLFTRPGELRNGEWTEINLETAEWRIPAARMKMRQQHIVPLSIQAVSLLNELHKLSGSGKYLFPSANTITRPISDMAMLTALRRMGYEKDELCVHGFRSMASTLLNEQGYNRDWIERQLAHGERNGVRAAYNYAEYLPERRKMMQEWSDYLDGLRG